MAEIRGFRGWRYNKSKVSDPARVLAPPYDVISPKERDAFYHRHPANVIRLELGKDLKGDNARHNKYTRARDLFNAWAASGILQDDLRRCLYIYVQDYLDGNKRRRRVGFIAAMKIDQRSVLKHENTLAAPKKDRFSLIKEVRANLSPIWGLYEDRSGVVWRALSKASQGKPAVDITVEKVRHRLFVTGNRELIDQVSGGMRGKPMFIADGHHRFEVACQYRRWARSQGAREGADSDYVMTYFSDVTNNPFTIWPTHRLIKKPARVKDALMALSGQGTLTKVSGKKAVLTALAKTREQARDLRYRFGVYAGKKGYFIFTLSPKLSKRVKKDPVSRLDVAVLHRFLIEPCFGIKKIEKSEAIDFNRDADAAVAAVDRGRFDLALFLRPTSLEEMMLASKKGLKMPQKSTYFYPKLLTGLVFHRFDPPQSAADLRR